MKTTRALAFLALIALLAAQLAAPALAQVEMVEDEEEGGESPEGMQFANQGEPDGEAGEEEPEPFADETNVVILDKTNFTAFIEREGKAIVEFYAPWCGHCKQLKPVWAELADNLKGSLKVAKIDSTENADVGDLYNVEGFPTIVFIDGEKNVTYNGERDLNSMLGFAQKKLGMAFLDIAAEDKLINTMAGPASSVVGFFKDEDSALFRAYKEHSMADDERSYSLCKDEKLAAAAGVQMGQLVIFRQDGKSVFDSQTATADDVNDFVKSNIHSVFLDFNQENMDPLFANELPKVFVFFPEDAQKMKQEITEAASKAGLRGKTIFSIAGDSVEKEFFDFMGLKKDEPKLIALAVNDKGDKYSMNDGEAVTVENVIKFAEDVIANKANREYKSEDIPEGDAAKDGEVHSIVGKNFQEFIDQDKTVVVEFFAPWCQHCQKFEPKYQKAAQYFAERTNDIVLAKIDGSANEVKGMDVQGFPTVYLFPKGAKDSPLDISEHTQNLKKFVNQIKEQSGIDFNSLPGEQEYRDAVKGLKTLLRKYPKHLSTASRHINAAAAEIRAAEDLKKDEL